MNIELFFCKSWSRRCLLWLGVFGLACALFNAPALSGPIDNPTVKTGIWTDIVDGHDPQTITAPQWKSNLPFRVNELYIGMSSENLAKVMGQPERQTEGEANVYGDNAVIRLNEGRVVNISVARSLGDRGTVWTLGQGQAEFLKLGASETTCFEKLGRPFAFYVHKKKGIRIALYSQARCDLGIFFKAGQAEGVLMTEPGLLAEGLRWSGYVLETE